MKAAELNLAPGPALQVALALEAQCPGVVFTSGARTPDSQAQAMASNIAIAGPSWLASTYKASPVLRKCIAAVLALQPEDRNDPAALATALLGAFVGFSLEELAELSEHLSREAFDVQPGTCPLELLERLVNQAVADGAVGKLLTLEGGLVRWHVQLAEALP